MSLKKTLFQLNILLVICMFAFIACNSRRLSMDKDSEAIPKDTAKLLRRDYRHHGNVIRTVTVKNHRRRALKFEFDTSSIQEILTKNVSGFAAPDTVALIFGLEKPAKGKRWHCMIYGVRNKQLLESPGTSGRYSIFDNVARDGKCVRKSKKEADTLRSVYKRPGNILKSLAWDGAPIEIEGVMFLASQIQEIITDNQSGKSPDKVVFYFGLEYVSKKGKRLHIVAYGKKKRKLLDTYIVSPAKNPISGKAVLNRASVFDKADPYPPR